MEHLMPNATRRAALAILSLLVLALGGCTRNPPPAASARSAGTEQRFADPKAAVDALLAACRTNDDPALLAIFGADARALVSTGDPEQDRERCARLVAAAKQVTRLDPKGPDTLELVVGYDDFPFPIPLVRDAGGWRFDTEEGANEILRRRVGADELEAISVCRAYDTTRQAPSGTWRGYNFRTAQGQGALVAYPVTYGSTGIMTFVAVGGRVYEKDLGEKTAKAVDAMKTYQPDGSWSVVTD
jgi:Protein of unknown function (DUF2950)